MPFLFLHTHQEIVLCDSCVIHQDEGVAQILADPVEQSLYAVCVSDIEHPTHSAVFRQRSADRVSSQLAGRSAHHQ